MLWIGGLALGVGVVGGLWLRADAASDRVGELRALCERDRSYHRRAAALAELRDIGSSAAHDALESLAGSSDARLAAQAAAEIGRADYSGAKSKLADLVGDTKRPDMVRGAALAALAAAESTDGKSWSDVSTRVSASLAADKELAELGDALEDRAFAAKGGAK